MKRVIRSLVSILIPLLVPVLEKLVDDAVTVLKKKLTDQLVSESLTIQKQLRSLSDVSPLP